MALRKIIPPPRAIRDFVLARDFGWDEEQQQRQRTQWVIDILTVGNIVGEFSGAPAKPGDRPSGRRPRPGETVGTDTVLSWDDLFDEAGNFNPTEDALS